MHRETLSGATGSLSERAEPEAKRTGGQAASGTHNLQTLLLPLKYPSRCAGAGGVQISCAAGNRREDCDHVAVFEVDAGFPPDLMIADK